MAGNPYTRYLHLEAELEGIRNEHEGNIKLMEEKQTECTKLQAEIETQQAPDSPLSLYLSLKSKAINLSDKIAQLENNIKINAHQARIQQEIVEARESDLPARRQALELAEGLSKNKLQRMIKSLEKQHDDAHKEQILLTQLVVTLTKEKGAKEDELRLIQIAIRSIEDPEHLEVTLKTLRTNLLAIGSEVNQLDTTVRRLRPTIERKKAEVATAKRALLDIAKTEHLASLNRARNLFDLYGKCASYCLTCNIGIGIAAFYCLLRSQTEPCLELEHGAFQSSHVSIPRKGMFALSIFAVAIMLLNSINRLRGEGARTKDVKNALKGILFLGVPQAAFQLGKTAALEVIAFFATLYLLTRVFQTLRLVTPDDLDRLVEAKANSQVEQRLMETKTGMANR